VDQVREAASVFDAGRTLSGQLGGFQEFLQKYDIPIDEAFFSGASKARSVLVVDDEADIREIVRRVLKELDPNLRIEEASDGYEAGIKIGAMQPDLVVMDVMMPRVDGLSLCRSIRENPDTACDQSPRDHGVPEHDSIRKMYDAGADLCLMKPIQFEHFRLEVLRL
jgi:CheY-like chemotaxis protein